MKLMLRLAVTACAAPGRRLRSWLGNVVGMLDLEIEMRRLGEVLF